MTAELYASSLLADAMTRAAPAQRQHMEALGVELEKLDLAHGLPTALSHPDFSPANIILGPDGPVPVDWTGAGTAPRVGALAWLLATRISAHAREAFGR